MRRGFGREKLKRVCVNCVFVVASTCTCIYTIRMCAWVCACVCMHVHVHVHVGGVCRLFH